MMPATRMENLSVHSPEILPVCCLEALVRRSLRSALPFGARLGGVASALPFASQDSTYTHRSRECFATLNEKSPCMSHLKEGPLLLFSCSTQYGKTTKAFALKAFALGSVGKWQCEGVQDRPTALFYGSLKKESHQSLRPWTDRSKEQEVCRARTDRFSIPSTWGHGFPLGSAGSSSSLV
jgi:hypothetical protein